MTIGKVNVTNENLAQGPTAEIERTALYVGVSATGRNAVNAIGPKTDLVNLLGAKASGTLVKQLEAAQLNGGGDWQAYAVGIDDKVNFAAAIDLAMATKNVEYIVITDPVMPGPAGFYHRLCSRDRSGHPNLGAISGSHGSYYRYGCS